MIDYSPNIKDYSEMYLLWFEISTKIWEIERFDVSFKESISIWGEADWYSKDSKYEINSDLLASLSSTNKINSITESRIYNGADNFLNEISKFYDLDFDDNYRKNILKQSLMDDRLRTIFEFRELWPTFQEKFPQMYIDIHKRNAEKSLVNQKKYDMIHLSVSFIEPHAKLLSGIGVDTRIFQMYIINKILSVREKIGYMVLSILGFLLIYFVSKKIVDYNKKYDPDSVGSDTLFMILITCISLFIASVTI